MSTIKPEKMKKDIKYILTVLKDLDGDIKNIKKTINNVKSVDKSIDKEINKSNEKGNKSISSTLENNIIQYIDFQIEKKLDVELDGINSKFEEVSKNVTTLKSRIVALSRSIVR
jgi:hypothetical protein